MGTRTVIPLRAETGQRVVLGSCPHDCPDTCAIVTVVENGRAIEFGANPDHPYTNGWLCAKVRPYLNRVYAPDRLTYPLRRTGAKGSDQWERISWDEAIEQIVSRWQTIIAEHGAAAILPYSFTGTLGLVQMKVASSRLWNRMGASGLGRNMCDAAVEPAYTATLGASLSPDPSELLQSKVILVWGTNPASTSPHLMPILREAQRNGAQVIVIDPRRSLTARSANLHIPVRPGTDTALALGLMNELFSQSLHDELWLEANSIGWQALRDRAAGYDLAKTEAITGVDASQITSLARLIGTTKPVAIRTNDGIQRQKQGGQTIRSLLSLSAVLGQIGVTGGGVHYSQSGWLTWDAEAVGHRSECVATPRTILMNQLGAALLSEPDGIPMKSLFVFGANPVTSSPNTSKIIEGLMRDDLFTVVHEQFMTETARYADIVLPATTQLEQIDLHIPSGHRHLHYNHQAIEPLGEAKSNWDVSRLLARGMGYTEPWLFQEPDSVLEEIIESTRPATSLLDGITLQRLQDEGPIPYGEHLPTPFSDLTFPTQSGKVELYSDQMIAWGADPLPGYEEPVEFVNWSADEPPLVLLTPASHHFVSSSMANQPELAAKEGIPFVEISAIDAEQRNIEDGDFVQIHNRRGSCQLRAKVTSNVQPGVAVAPKGRWGDCKRGVNWLTSDDVSDIGDQATFHTNLVAITRAAGPKTVDQAVELLVPSPAD